MMGRDVVLILLLALLFEVVVDAGFDLLVHIGDRSRLVAAVADDGADGYQLVEFLLNPPGIQFRNVEMALLVIEQSLVGRRGCPRLPAIHLGDNIKIRQPGFELFRLQFPPAIASAVMQRGERHGR